MYATAKDTFESQRPRLIGLSYRITGSRAEAEDIVQETFIKWLHADHKKINSAQAWLTTIATRLSLDYLKSARVKRESYIGPWLPEPFVDNQSLPEHELALVINDTTPDQLLELDESISMALLVLLEDLSPAERASFILHDLFHFDFAEIGKILNRSAGSCRKLASRARLNIGRYADSSYHSTDEHKRILTAFFSAVKNGEIGELVNLLKENVRMHSDGGGKALAALEILHGSNTVAEFLLDKVRPDFVASESIAVTIGMTWFNGSPGIIVRKNGKPVTAFNFELKEGAISKIFALRNPDKLRLFGSS